MVANNNSPPGQRHEGSQVSTTNAMNDNLVDLSQIVDKKQFFIFGHNISHSLSPTLHNAGFQELGFPYHYRIHESENVDQTVEEMINRPDFGGASVTFPHKLQIGRLLDTVSEQGQNIGAINTIVVQEADGRRILHGDNTDWIGIRRCITKSGIQDFLSSSALVLGAGGAARAACYAIQTLGFHELIVVNRTLSKATELASRFSELKTRAFTSLEEADKAGDADIRLIVACIPADDLGEDKIPTGLFSTTGQGVLVEMAYRPQVTGMMTVAQRHSQWKVYRGVDILEEQGYAQFELWTGRQAPVETMRSALQARLASA
ncbi:shikimate-5-dehydrogenase [Fusarium sporotrichioides]|uniref:Shikimate-5-dehydrogenase n=1 Tax=Fusarium sporotrichioides TaxID=5514 RepID=A0A395SQG8_FUSSP|nr:shikimate-5-dehydrogenase [Fusarium sporotrichioides]